MRELCSAQNHNIHIPVKQDKYHSNKGRRIILTNLDSAVLLLETQSWRTICVIFVSQSCHCERNANNIGFSDYKAIWIFINNSAYSSSTYSNCACPSIVAPNNIPLCSWPSVHYWLYLILGLCGKLLLVALFTYHWNLVFSRGTWDIQKKFVWLVALTLANSGTCVRPMLDIETSATTCLIN